MDNENRPAFNPWIDPEDHYREYNRSIRENFDKEHFQYQELTYRVFSNTDALKWIEETKKILFGQMVSLKENNSSLTLATNQGARAIILEIERQVQAHLSYINATNTGQV